MTGDEIADQALSLAEEATAEEKMIETAYLAGVPLDPIFQQLHQEAVDDWTAARARRLNGGTADSGPA